MLECMEVDISDEDLTAIKKRFGMNYQGDIFIKYEPVLKSFKFDNHKEKWVVVKVNDDDALLRNTVNMRTSLDHENKHKVLSQYNLQQLGGEDQESHEFYANRSRVGDFISKNGRRSNATKSVAVSQSFTEFLAKGS